MSSPRSSELVELGGSTSSSQYLAELWRRRDFLVVVPRQDARARQMTTVLGQAWHLLNPLIMTGVYFLVFGVILGVDRGIDAFIGFLTIGVLMFQLTQRVTLDAAGSIPANDGLIRSVQFPRALLPLSVVIQHAVSFVPATAIMIVVAIADYQRVTWRVLLLPLPLVAMVLVSTGLALIAARVGAFVHDLREILPHAFRILLYFSGVLFSLDRFVGHGAARAMLMANPIFEFIAVARWCLVGTPVSWGVPWGLAAWSISLPVVGLVWFRRSEHRYGG